MTFPKRLFSAVAKLLNGKFKWQVWGFWRGVRSEGRAKMKEEMEMSKRKDVPLLMSAAGWIGGFIGELIPALRECGIPDEEIHAYVKDGGKAPVDKIAKVLTEAIRQAKNIFQIVIGQYKTTEEAVAAGKYDWSNDSINNKNFPYRSRPKGKRKIVLFEFDYDPTSEQVLAEAERQGLARPDYEDALDFGEQHPDIQLEQRPVVFLHEPWQDSGVSRDVVVLLGGSSGRDLDLRSFDDKWLRRCRFAFVRK